MELDLSNIYVLLVEDNVVNQTILAKQLKRAGCTVTIANHGLEALERLRETRLWHENLDGGKMDIILMDWEMPVMDGLTCAKEIRMLETTGQLVGHVEIIATTANARDEQLQKVLESGIVCQDSHCLFSDCLQILGLCHIKAFSRQRCLEADERSIIQG